MNKYYGCDMLKDMRAQNGIYYSDCSKCDCTFAAVIPSVSQMMLEMHHEAFHSINVYAVGIYIKLDN